MSIELCLSEIPEIKELPKLERNEEKEGFTYPPEYIGNVYKHNGKLIFFNEKTVEEASIGMINLLVSLISKAKDDESEVIQTQKNLESEFKVFELNVVELIKRVESTFENYVQIDKLNQFITNNNYITKEEFDSISKEYALINDVDKYSKHIEQEFTNSNLEIFKQIEELKNRSDLKDIISSKVDEKLVDVYNNFKQVTENLVREEVRKIEDEIKLKSNRLTASQIIMFKEMGLSIENIIELKKSNLL
jgi:hypothetical protein